MQLKTHVDVTKHSNRKGQYVWAAEGSGWSHQGMGHGGAEKELVLHGKPMIQKRGGGLERKLEFQLDGQQSLIPAYMFQQCNSRRSILT